MYGIYRNQACEVDWNSTRQGHTACGRKYAYPEQLEHNAEHERLLEELGRHGSGLFEANTQFLFSYGRKWLQDHILAQDKALGAFLKEEGGPHAGRKKAH
jgi:hemerythrin